MNVVWILLNKQVGRACTDSNGTQNQTGNSKFFPLNSYFAYLICKQSQKRIFIIKTG